MSESSRPGPGSSTSVEPVPASEGSPTHALRALVQVAQATPGAVARRAGLSHNELAVLDLLSEGSRGPSELARALGVTSAAASGIVDRLVARGHAQRVPHEADRRRTLVELSESGRAEALAHLRPMLVALARLDGDLTEEERRLVTRYLQEATEAIRQVL